MGYQLRVNGDFFLPPPLCLPQTQVAGKLHAGASFCSIIPYLSFPIQYLRRVCTPGQIYREIRAAVRQIKRMLHFVQVLVFSPDQSVHLLFYLLNDFFCLFLSILLFADLYCDLLVSLL